MAQYWGRGEGCAANHRTERQRHNLESGFVTKNEQKLWRRLFAADRGRLSFRGFGPSTNFPHNRNNREHGVQIRGADRDNHDGRDPLGGPRNKQNQREMKCREEGHGDPKPHMPPQFPSHRNGKGNHRNRHKSRSCKIKSPEIHKQEPQKNSSENDAQTPPPGRCIFLSSTVMTLPKRTLQSPFQLRLCLQPLRDRKEHAQQERVGPPGCMPRTVRVPSLYLGRGSFMLVSA